MIEDALSQYQHIGYFNQSIRDHLSKLEIKFIELNTYFEDSYGKLNITYSNDGLHLNEKGYNLLKAILEKELV